MNTPSHLLLHKSVVFAKEFIVVNRYTRLKKHRVCMMTLFTLQSLF